MWELTPCRFEMPKAKRGKKAKTNEDQSDIFQ
jgi:hypothetical protein